MTCFCSFTVYRYLCPRFELVSFLTDPGPTFNLQIRIPGSASLQFIEIGKIIEHARTECKDSTCIQVQQLYFLPRGGLETLPGLAVRCCLTKIQVKEVRQGHTYCSSRSHCSSSVCSVLNPDVRPSMYRYRYVARSFSSRSPKIPTVEKRCLYMENEHLLSGSVNQGFGAGLFWGGSSSGNFLSGAGSGSW